MIVQAQNKHLSDIIKIEKLSFNHPWSEMHFKKDIRKKDFSINWVMLEDGKTIGYIFGWLVENEYHLNNIAVHPNHRRKGIAAKLLLKLINSVKIKNAKKLFLEVRADNFPAKKLYKSFGFTAMGLRKNYYDKGNDAILYNLELIDNG
jgi:ribosomal-protein-alanine N-acetyltransferase